MSNWADISRQRRFFLSKLDLLYDFAAWSTSFEELFEALFISGPFILRKKTKWTSFQLYYL